MLAFLSDILPTADLSTTALVLFIVCIVAVAAFEFVNGFHDTANAVATVIYTKSLKPVPAVVWSGVWNFLGVLTGGIAVAMSIINLLPLDGLMDKPLYENIAIIIAMLFTAIFWNLLTWYYGIPCSSSHTLIGSLIGGGLGFQYIHGGTGVNWSKASDIGLSLLLSPAFGFSMVILLMFLMRILIKDIKIFKEPEGDSPPPVWIRGILILTCTAVSYSHGSNDGQKGVGLLMVILLTFAPMQYAINTEINPTQVSQNLTTIQEVLTRQAEKNSLKAADLNASVAKIEGIKSDLVNIATADQKMKFSVRKRLQDLRKKEVGEYVKDATLISDEQDRKTLKTALADLTPFTDFAPFWVVLLISLSLGIGTMIGWKRIVLTIGEKIGKTHLTYAQGAAAEITAATTIGLSTGLGLPVSTTHVLSSGIAGSMVASNGLQNLQRGTIRNILLAWILTLPVTVGLAAAVFVILYKIMV
ncbi:inorganic phosphate transporter [Hugenholtzia roseola]|uniref:inorganic phosphate transporter n=1 Tax=Hugenholtzia roseola TaxID=1002 RepID=UPI0006857900|nr:inorganic phosphate transporter [Hugenholtzia roseola]